MKSRSLIYLKRFFTHGGPVFVGLAVYCIINAWLTLTKAADQDAWPETRGIVTLSRVEAPTTESQKSTYYYFAYEYQVKDKTYRSERYSFGAVGGGQAVAVKHYKKGDQARVYYDPQDPSYAVLVREPPGLFVYLFLILRFFFLLAAISTPFWPSDPVP